MPFDRVALLGTGLIGASVGLALKAARPGTSVTGYDVSGEHLRQTQQAKAMDRAASLPAAVKDADLVVVATPVGSMRALFEEMAPFLKPGVVVTDTGSTKAEVLAWAQVALPEGASFVGGHPMAGKTETGPEAAEATLFQGSLWCLVPAPTAARQSIEAVAAMVESFGAVPYFLDAQEHDGLVASVSHLPYLLAVALVGHLGAEPAWREAATVAAGGFAYGSHLADSDPRMFADIVRSNRENVIRRLDLYVQELTSLRDAIAADDPGLKARFERAREHHQDWLAGRVQGRSAVDTGEPLPTTGSLLMGSLFGRLGRGKDGHRDRD